MQLQKILYDIQREFLKQETKAFSEEIEARQFGAVVPEVYKQYCGFGALPVRMRYMIDIESDDVMIIDPIAEKKRMLDLWDMVSDTSGSMFRRVGHIESLPVKAAVGLAIYFAEHNTGEFHNLFYNT